MGSISNLRDRFYDTGRGRVDYGRLKDSHEFQDYRHLTRGLQDFDLQRLVGRRSKLSFWVNLYNTIVVDAIATLGIENSVREVPELFRKVKYAIGEYLFSPDDIEHGILRGNARPWFSPVRQFGFRDPRREWIMSPADPRIHFALVCGSRSCAPIDYYDPIRIDQQLEEAARSFVNSSEVIVLPEEGRVLLSEIFKWYQDDFGGRLGVLDFLYDYVADESNREYLREHGRDAAFEYLHYDWNLNR
jgi:hypothetical protein